MTDGRPSGGAARSRLSDLVDAFSGKRVAVWGDLILDEYLYGTTRRVSREAPVLILKYAGSQYSLGGAGNALLNLKALGAVVEPVAVVGRDEAGRALLDIMKRSRIPTAGVIRQAGFRTPVKTRILAGEENTRKQQILRLDRESAVPDSAEVKKASLAALRRAARKCDALLISDYNYLTVQEDVFRRALPLFRRAGKAVTLDSRFRLLRFPGVTAATPNEPEAAAAAGGEIGYNRRSLLEAGRLILGRLHSPALLLTRGSRGMALFEKGRPAVLLPVRGTTDIVDVAGAGDTVISVFTLALACGASFREAAVLSNMAGGLAVMKKGTAVLSPAELKQAATAET
jgi:rfaE bifunctional protein kinase chain/domain